MACERARARSDRFDVGGGPGDAANALHQGTRFGYRGTMTQGNWPGGGRASALCKGAPSRPSLKKAMERRSPWTELAPVVAICEPSCIQSANRPSDNQRSPETPTP